MLRRAGLALVVTCALACLFALTSTPTANAAVMGIDFGSEFIKVASVKPGTPFHIVVDEQSKRKIPAMVAFDNGERQFGNGAIQLAMRKPKETYMWAQRLLGKDINSPQVAELKRQGFAWDIIELPERKTLGFRHSKAKKEGDSDVVFSVEEIVAMSLQHVMKIAEADAESVVKDCVITVPPYWTHRERQAMLDAAEIAGLNVLSLINENTAAAIQYGIDRKYNVSEPAHTILMYNMGSTSTTVDLATYTGYLKKERGGKNKTIGQFEMRASGYDETLGGNAFEQRIADWVVTEVNKQFLAKKITYDIRTNPKAMAKIRSSAEKAKTVLSANQESQIFLNSLHEDTDFKMMLTREQFVEMTADLIERATLPIQQVLDETGLTSADIDAVVIIGGGVRIPAIQAQIKAFTQKDYLTQSLNGDEAMVMGAVFRAANLSTAFQVRPFGLIDTSPYAIGVRITSDVSSADAAAETAEPAVATDADAAATEKKVAFSKRASLFKRHNRLSKKKTVQFTHTGDFEAQLMHESTKSNPVPTGVTLPIDHYAVSGLTRMVNNSKYTELLKEQKPRVSLSFLLDSSGISTLVRAEATLEEMIQVPKPKKVKTDVADAKEKDAEAEKAEKDEKATEEKTEADATEKKPEDAAATEEKKEEPAATTEGEEKKVVEGEKAAEGEDAEPEFTLKKKTHTVPLQVVKTGSPGSVESMNATHKILAKAALEKLRRADDLKKEIAAAKNALESYVYSTRSALSEPDVEQVSTEEQRTTLVADLAAAEEWLYEQGDDSATIFKDKLAALKALSDPIFFRLSELAALPIAINTTKTMIAFINKQVIDYAKNRPWVPEADRMKLKMQVDNLQDFLEEKQEAQAKLTANEPAVLESEQLNDRMRPIHKLSSDLMKLKKPIEKAKPKKKADKKGGKKNGKKASDAEKTTEEEATKDAEAATDAEKPAATEDAEAPAKEEATETTTEGEKATTEDPAKEEL